MNEKEIILNLLERAIKGDLSLNEFWNVWPKEADAHPFYFILRNDLEEAVEHTPGYFFKAGINYDLWHKTEMYKVLLIDLTVLKTSADTDIMIECRCDIISSKQFTLEKIIEKVEKCVELKRLGKQ